MQRTDKRIKITAKTLKKALIEAETLLGADSDEIEHRLISQTKGGLFSFIGKKVEIEAWKKSKVTRIHPSSKSRKKPQSKGTPYNKTADNSSEVKESFTDQEIEDIKENIKAYCIGICEYLVDSENFHVEAYLSDGRLVLDIEDEYLSGQVAKNIKIAESIEHILRKKPKHLKRELPFRVFVDVNGIRQKREGDLIEMAQDLSEKVHGNKRPIVLNYKSSYDRKIIHMALDKDDRVYTKSIGVGNNRKLMILPVKKREKEQRAN